MASPRQPGRRAVTPASSPRRLLDRYCVTCHNERLKTADLRLDRVDVANPGAKPKSGRRWCASCTRASCRRPTCRSLPQADRLALLTWLETSLDAASAAKPNPGRTETLRRLNRTEYQNAIRDLLALDIDAASLLPADESGHGFDNVNVGDLSPTLLDRYISAAQKISRLAVGSTQSSLQSDTIQPACRSHAGRSVCPGCRLARAAACRCPTRLPRTASTRSRSGSRAIWQESSAGCARAASARDAGAARPASRSQTFTIREAAVGDDTLLDKDLKARVTVSAGPHDIGVTFVKDGSSLIETRQAAYSNRASTTGAIRVRRPPSTRFR